MSFDINSIDQDIDFKKEDKKMNKFSNSILQDVMLGTYWSNVVGKTGNPGVYENYLNELRDTMYKLIWHETLTYRQLENVMVDYGYEVSDIRKVFKEITNVDPVKIEYMRLEDVKRTPGSIPTYNMGWGQAKDGKGYYFIDKVNNVYTIFHQEDDMTRKEFNYFVNYKDAKEELKKITKDAIFYDIPLTDYIDSLFRPYDYKNSGKDKIHRKADEDSASEVAGSDPNAKEMQAVKLEDELKSKTPVERFQDTIKDKVDTYIADYIKEVTKFVNEKNLELKKYEVSIRNIHYEKKENITPIIRKIDVPDSKNTPGTVISVVLQVRSLSLSEDKNKRFALALFFVDNNGKVSTTDSVKGEDDIIYGFSDEGFDKYFSLIK